MSDESMNLFGEMHPYAQRFPVFKSLPEQGLGETEVLRAIEYMSHEENQKWLQGQCSGTMYHGGLEHYDFLNQVFSHFSYVNLLQRDLCPSGTKFEAEALAMVGKMLHGDAAGEVAGAVTSGGSESIYNAMYVYREWGRAEKGIEQAEVVAPNTIHPAFLKAAHYLNMKVIRTPVNQDFEADPAAMRAQITPNTVALLASAGSYPHGVVDPISQLSDLALERQIGLHVDGCLGGFILPWIEKLGYPLPVFDFRNPGVTSMSCDTHKYGYALKGTSTVIFRHKNLRRYMFFAQEDWPGGVYASPTVLGSRSAGLSAAMWAALVSTGEAGYLADARAIMTAADTIRAGIAQIPELRIMGKSTFLISITSDVVDPYFVNDYLAMKDWRMNGCQNPPGFHFCITLPQSQPGVAERFVADLQAAVEFAKHPPYETPKSGFLYGMGASPEGREVLKMGLHAYTEACYELE